MEVYKQIPNFNGLYEVSNLGNVRRTGRQTITKTGAVVNYFPKDVKISLNNSGYYICYLTDRKGRSKTYSIQKLVYMTFKGEIPEGYHVDHIDEIKTNNHVENLQLLTIYDNVIKAKKNMKSSSKYTGVSKTRSGNWQATIYRKGVRKHLGTFESEAEAGQAYMDAYDEYERKNPKKS